MEQRKRNLHNPAANIKHSHCMLSELKLTRLAIACVLMSKYSPDPTSDISPDEGTSTEKKLCSLMPATHQLSLCCVKD